MIRLVWFRRLQKRPRCPRKNLWGMTTCSITTLFSVSIFVLFANDLPAHAVSCCWCWCCSCFPANRDACLSQWVHNVGLLVFSATQLLLTTPPAASTTPNDWNFSRSFALLFKNDTAENKKSGSASAWRWHDWINYSSGRRNGVMAAEKKQRSAKRRGGSMEKEAALREGVVWREKTGVKWVVLVLRSRNTGDGTKLVKEAKS